VSSARIDATVGGSRQQISSDVRGQFVLPLLPSGDVRLSIRAPGFAPLVQTVKLEQRRDEVRFELRPGGGISGQVEDARVSGLPDGLEVFLELPGGERLPIAVAPDGHFTETGVPTGTVVLRARARGYAAVQKVLQVPEGSSPDQVTLRDVRLRFVRGAQLLGQVRLAGRSFEGADIQVQNEEGQLLARTRTDRRGEFELADLPPGKLRVQASSAQGSASQTVELRPGDRPQIELELAGR
ncbi:MAG TPA: carboxypeptidase-like regulatory domain-containing protein, partial [Pseudomonadota bacterium]|nr:carboxypeptidase-like regulatory domain-containing protein [Pseudomonadota bacterium]